MKTILGIGECMIELSSAGENLWRQGFAGDVFNALWYAQALAQSKIGVAFYTSVGTDQISDQLLDFIETAGISCSDAPRVAGRVPGLYSIHLDGVERSFSYWRETSAARLMMQYPQQLWTKVAAADLIYFSGISLAILSADDAAAFLSGLRTHLKPGALVAFDPNIRPHLWDDAKRMKQVISDAGALSDIVLPSFDDEKSTFGDATPRDTALRYQSLGASHVVVKDGENPTLLLHNGEFASFPVAPTTGVVDTTAAGDSFNGAYLSEVLKGRPLAEAICTAQNCAAKVVCTKGALVPYGQLDDLAGKTSIPAT